MGANVGWCVWAHPTRRRWVRELKATLDADIPTIWDQVKTPSRDPRQRWNVCCRVLRKAASQGHEFVGWIQDDAIVCRDFTASVAAALDAAGSPIVLSPYTGTGRPDQLAARRAVRTAELAGNAFMPLRSLYWGVAVVFPTEHVEQVIQIASRPVFKHSPSDYRVGVALRDYFKLRTWYTLPSLADHRDEHSLVGHDKPGQPRRAHQFIGTDQSGLDIDWTRLPASETDTHGNLRPHLPHRPPRHRI